jgi:hypothetical protein
MFTTPWSYTPADVTAIWLRPQRTRDPSVEPPRTAGREHRLPRLYPSLTGCFMEDDGHLREGETMREDDADPACLPHGSPRGRPRRVTTGATAMAAAAHDGRCDREGGRGARRRV